MKKRLLAFVLLLAIAASLAACGKESEKPSETPGGNAGLDVDEIVIGYVGAITGPSAGLGAPVHEMVAYAVEEINQDGGICGVPVRYVYRDDQGDPTKATTYCQELVYKENVDLMIAPVNSTCVSANLDLLTDEKIITFICSASATELVDPEKYPYIFRTTVVNNFMAEDLVASAKKVGYKNIVLLADNSTTGIDGMRYMKDYCKELGVEYVDAVEYTMGAVDMSPVAQRIADANADCVISFALGTDAANIVGALDRVGMTGKYDFLSYMGGVVGNFEELAGTDATDNVYYQGLKSGSVIADDPNPNLGYGQEFYDFITDTFGEAPADGTGRTWGWIPGARAYDCILLLKAAIEEANSMDPNLLKETIEGFTNFKSVLYESGYSFGPDDHEGFGRNEIANCYMGNYVWNVGRSERRLWLSETTSLTADRPPR